LMSFPQSMSSRRRGAGIQCLQIVLDACLRRACPCGGRGMTEFRTFFEFVILRWQKTDDGCQMSDDGGRKQMTENRWWMTEDQQSRFSRFDPTASLCRIFPP
jgi:hypothetical protein